MPKRASNGPPRRLAANANYAGETWIIPATELAAGDSAAVNIHVETIAGQSERRSVRVEADYADALDFHSRQENRLRSTASDPIPSTVKAADPGRQAE